jgi:hypothetical protein
MVWLVRIAPISRWEGTLLNGPLSMANKAARRLGIK